MSSGAAAIVSLFVPGLGQLCQGRWFIGPLVLLLAIAGYMACIVPGIIVHGIAVIDAAQYKK